MLALLETIFFLPFWVPTKVLNDPGGGGYCGATPPSIRTRVTSWLVTLYFVSKGLVF